MYNKSSNKPVNKLTNNSINKSENKPMKQIANMHYYYYKQYFESENQGKVNYKENTEAIFKYRYKGNQPLENRIQGLEEFSLKTMYPGLLIGIGYSHDLKEKDVLKCGFSFDYVTGLPYIPGSSIKGVLRSYFPGENKEEYEMKESYIKGILNKEDLNVEELKKNIFDDGDIFLDAYPESKGVLLASEFITPHTAGKFKNPNPIQLLKVKPDVTFQFYFKLQDYKVDGNTIVSSQAKLELFKTIILDMGLGAKTNVGFGKWAES